MITRLAKTDSGVINDFYFFGHRWSRYFILLSATTLSAKCLGMTWYLDIVHTQKCFYVTREFYRFLHRGWAKFSSVKWSNFNLQRKVVWRRQGCEFQGLFNTTSTIQDLFKTVRTMANVLRHSSLSKPFVLNILHIVKWQEKWRKLCKTISKSITSVRIESNTETTSKLDNLSKWKWRRLTDWGRLLTLKVQLTAL